MVSHLDGINFFHINAGRWDEAGINCSYTLTKFRPTCQHKVGRSDDFLHKQLEGGVESACKHSMISSNLPDYELKGWVHFLIYTSPKR